MMDFDIKIYKIWSPCGDKVYIGSTKDELSRRMATHRRDYKNWKSGKKSSSTTSKILFDEYGLKNCFIELIIKKPCNNRTERDDFEKYYINKIECVNILMK